MDKTVQVGESLEKCFRSEQIKIKVLFIHQRSEKSSDF